MICTISRHNSLSADYDPPRFRNSTFFRLRLAFGNSVPAPPNSSRAYWTQPQSDDDAAQLQTIQRTMAATEYNNMSHDLLWLCTRTFFPHFHRARFSKISDRNTSQETTARSRSSAAAPEMVECNSPATPLTSQISTPRRSVNNFRKDFPPLQPSNPQLTLIQYEGYIAPQAIGVQPGNENNGVTLLTKKADKNHKPASCLQITNFGPNTSTRKTYRSIVNSTARRSYRPDLRGEAVARASAIRRAQKPKPDDRPTKLRGAKARKAARGLKA